MYSLGGGVSGGVGGSGSVWWGRPHHILPSLPLHSIYTVPLLWGR